MDQPMNPATRKIVVCADSQRAILLDGMRRQIIWMLSINAALWLLGELFHVEWLPAIGIFGLIVFYMAPRLLSANRHLSQLTCPACDQPSGDYFTEKSRIHLRCNHCGEVSPTDCGVGVCGGIPYKITW